MLHGPRPRAQRGGSDDDSRRQQARRSQNAVRDAVDRGRPPCRRQHFAAIERAAWRQRALRRGLAGALGAANAGQDLSRRAGEPRRTVDHGHLQGRVAGRAIGRRLDSVAEDERKTSARHPQRQQRRSRAVCAGGDACRRTVGRDIAGLFADVPGFRQAQRHDQPA